jgi:hypothetical protein
METALNMGRDLCLRIHVQGSNCCAVKLVPSLKQWAHDANNPRSSNVALRMYGVVVALCHTPCSSGLVQSLIFFVSLISGLRTGLSQPYFETCLFTRSLSKSSALL